MRLREVQKIYINTIPGLLIGLGMTLILFGFWPIIRDEVWFFYIQSFYTTVSTKEVNAPVVSEVSKDSKFSVFASMLTGNSYTLNPVNKDFSIIIPKIGISAPITKNVSVTDKEEYLNALKSGIAHASISDLPSKTEIGNVYLFAHATINFWELGKYATTFNLLRKLEAGDLIYVYYENEEYIYKVEAKDTIKGWDVSPLQRKVLNPILTLQTCDPPGTTWNRLIVTAILVN